MRYPTAGNGIGERASDVFLAGHIVEPTGAPFSIPDLGAHAVPAGAQWPRTDANRRRTRIDESWWRQKGWGRRWPHYRGALRARERIWRDRTAWTCGQALGSKQRCF